MAVYTEEEEVWKCPKHPSKRRRSGICPICLRDRLIALCPDCRNARPCSCCLITSSSSSASSSFSLFSSSGRGGSARSSNVAAGEPSFIRSRSLAIPFLRTKVPDSCDGTPARSKSSFWWGFMKQKRRKEEERSKIDEGFDDSIPAIMRRSQSVSVLASRNSDGGGGGDGKSSLSWMRKGKGWHFPSPMNVFRQSALNRGC
ncbi:uncharacterized protein LOC124927837 [Impatiens glandulifera]|uniref:uncharacterized protein LOC124927837 n=1 Tax=Impatiens glandulifera TaxID=253017 RepID=UPI001FB187F6|nr:uncharacterized protein LOC124927837 [Impatiens glandulifera]